MWANGETYERDEKQAEIILQEDKTENMVAKHQWIDILDYWPTELCDGHAFGLSYSKRCGEELQKIGSLSQGHP